MLEAWLVAVIKICLNCYTLLYFEQFVVYIQPELDCNWDSDPDFRINLY